MTPETERALMVGYLQTAEDDVKHWKEKLEAFDQAPERFQFATLEDAQGELQDTLWERAAEDCEGSHNCGLDEYRQEFFVAGAKHVAIFEPEYNRHDKRYYFVDGHKFRIEVVA